MRANRASIVLLTGAFGLIWAYQQRLVPRKRRPKTGSGREVVPKHRDFHAPVEHNGAIAGRTRRLQGQGQPRALPSCSRDQTWGVWVEADQFLADRGGDEVL